MTHLIITLVFFFSIPLAACLGYRRGARRYLLTALEEIRGNISAILNYSRDKKTNNESLFEDLIHALSTEERSLQEGYNPFLTLLRLARFRANHNIRRNE